LSEYFLQEYKQNGKYSCIHYKLSSTKTGLKIQEDIGWLKKDSVERNSIEAIIRNPQRYEKDIFEGYELKIEEVNCLLGTRNRSI
jgi:hypothetical protein